MSPVLGSMAQRSSRAGPIAFFAAEIRASSTAATRTSLLMPFSRSQNSKTAKKSAFISTHIRLTRGTKKSEVNLRLARAGGPADFTFCAENRHRVKASQDAKSQIGRASCRERV